MAKSSAIEVAARQYLDKGLSPIPLKPRSKEPLIPWKEFQSRHATREELRSWFCDGRNNIGTVTGAISNVTVIDVDVRHGGEKSMALLEQRFTRFPPTTEAVTGGGGRHYFFQHPGGVVPNSAGQLAAGIDVRGDGGYVAVAPSVHPCGNIYRWVDGRSFLDVPPTPLPQWLLRLIRHPVHNREQRREQWGEIASRSLEEGSRNSGIARLTGHLLRHRIDPSVALNLILSWNRDHCRPPLSDDEVTRVVRSIAGAEFARRQGGD
jgi:Bifunctional DNA primase/polymerase, N-terminal/Primase C terminal 1 (PriCT-1)